MLQAIRSKATSFVVKLLFGLLIVTFGIWGIGDIFRSRGPDTTVATVGGMDISADQVNQAVQTQLERLRGLFGGSIDADQAKQLGVVDQALQQIVSQDLIDLEIKRLGLAIGDETVRDAITANPAFHNEQGAFDRDLYAQVLLNNQMTEAQFEQTQRQDLLKAQLTGALSDGMTPPKELVDALYRARAEKRVAATITVPASALGAPPTPTDAELDTFYQAHKDDFRTPERRTFKVALLRLEDVAAGIAVSDADLKSAYDQRQDEFHTAEQRQLQQMLLPDEKTAQEAEKQLAAGTDFATVAKTVAKQTDPGALDLGWEKRDDLPTELADAAFALKQGGVSAPVKSTFGWYILRLVAIKPEQTQSFDQVKDKLKDEVQKDHASDKLADIANNIDDALAGGASFDDVAKKYAMKIVPAAAVDADGKDASGKAVDLPNSQTILKTAFSTDANQTSPLSELGDDGYFMVAVNSISPATTQPLADVRGAAVTAWQADQRQQALQKLADAMTTEVNGGKSIADVAAEHKLSVETTAPLQRSGNDPKVPPALVAKIFDAKKGGAVDEVSGDTAVVAQLQSVEPADPAKDPQAVQDLQQQLSGVFQTDMMDQYDQALRKTFPVSVDRSSLDHLL
ncbi:MAG TPA: SurA N-terminal domain-containing protein [Stellaceae bacterium]|nr:SurA N-terminal domain-containing protein [Stellaceae bacterium]